MSESTAEDWKTDPSTVALRTHLEANNGIKGLDILDVKDVANAVELFNRDGFVVVANVLNSEQIDFCGKDAVKSQQKFWNLTKTARETAGIIAIHLVGQA